MKIEEIIIESKKYEVRIYKRTKNNFILRYQKGVIKISIPKRASYKSALSLLKNKINWVKNQIEKESISFKEPKGLLYLGKYYKIQKENSFFSVYLDRVSIRVEKMEEIEKWFLEEANKIIKKRYEHISSYINLGAKDIKIKKLKSAWGICYSNKRITLNSLLLGAPIEIMDYVIIHELCHLVHMNHSKDFWALVERFCPNYKELKLWLKSNSQSLHNNPNI